MENICLEFCVPMHRYEGTILLSVDYYGFRSELLKAIELLGVSDVQSCIELKKVGEDEFEEEMLIIRCSSEKEDDLVQAYEELLVKYHKKFQHVFYIYRKNDFTHAFYISNGEVCHMFT